MPNNSSLEADHSRDISDDTLSPETILSGSRKSAKNVVSLSFRISTNMIRDIRSTDSFRVVILRETRDVRSHDNPSQHPISGSAVVFLSRPVSVTRDGLIFLGGVELALETLSGGDEYGPIEIRIIRAGSSEGKSSNQSRLASDQNLFLAKSFVTYADIERAGDSAGKKFLHIGFFGASSADPVAFGSLSVNGLTREYAFQDYLRSGLNLRIMVGIDMTRSNGDPTARGSLHSFNADGSHGASNEYVKVLTSVLGILEKFCGERVPAIPAYGFGAKISPALTRVAHCFSLIGDYFQPHVAGLEGVLRAYKEALGAVVLHGPTRFSELLKTAAGWAEPLEGSASYLVLLLITDGAMEDFQDTIDVLVNMARLPVSIIIVGVGDADFTQMEFLDGDKKPLVSKATGETLRRDLVQFVRYRDHPTPKALALASLDELPKQIVKYFSVEKVFPHIGGGFVGTKKKLTNWEPKFLSDQETDLLVSIHNTGYEEEIVERIIHETGVFSPDPMHVLDVMFSLKRRNALTWTGSASSSTSVRRTVAERMGVEDRLARIERAEIAKRRQSKITRQGQNLSVAENLVQTGLCRVCYTNTVDTIFKPCGHQIVCSDCSTKVGRLCPLCRATIDTAVDVGAA